MFYCTVGDLATVGGVADTALGVGHGLALLPLAHVADLNTNKN